MEGKIRQSQWLAKATAGIRFGPDRKAVEEELLAHMEDKCLDYQRIFPGMTPEEALERVMDQMGDAEEIGAELARVHRPWWGWLWQASRVLVWVAAACLLLALWAELPWRTDPSSWFREEPLGYSAYLDECYLSGVDPFGPGSPYEDYSGGEVTRFSLDVFEPEDVARTGDYRLSVPRAALWSFQRTGEQAQWNLFCELLAQGPPWQPMGWSVASHIRAVDDQGNQYFSTHDVYDAGVERGQSGYVLANWDAPDGPRTRYRLDISGIPPGTRWLRLEYDRAGTLWSLTIPLKEVTAG